MDYEAMMAGEPEEDVTLITKVLQTVSEISEMCEIRVCGCSKRTTGPSADRTTSSGLRSRLSYVWGVAQWMAASRVTHTFSPPFRHLHATDPYWSLPRGVLDSFNQR